MDLLYPPVSGPNSNLDHFGYNDSLRTVNLQGKGISKGANLLKVGTPYL
jgi:hypothetical protein